MTTSDRTDDETSNETNATERLSPESLAEIAEIHIKDERPEEAAFIYQQLAAAHRSRPGYAARALYAHGLVLARDGAVAEARQKLRHALALDPQLDAARTAYEALECKTTRIRAIAK